MRRKIIPDVIREQEVEWVQGSTTVRQAAQRMCEHNVGAVPILEDGALKGILTVNDIAYRVVAEGLDPDALIAEAHDTSDGTDLLRRFMAQSAKD